VRIDLEGSTALDQTFDSLAAALAFFDDSTLALALGPMTSDPLDLEVSFSLLASTGLAHFGFDWVVAAVSVPEPRSLALLALAIGTIVRRRALSARAGP